MNKLIFVSSLLLALSVLTYANSVPDPTQIGVKAPCDVMSSIYGCDPSNWTDGNRLQCGTKGQQMAWASKAVRSNCYVIIAGDENAPSTTYTPGGQIQALTIRTTCYGMAFRGMMMYAVNSAGQKVGTWETVGGDMPDWTTPWPDTHPSCGGVLMHAVAEIKPYVSQVYYVTPAANTGKITFKVLIKYGDANEGAFYWPKDLSLDENTATTPSSGLYLLGDAGKSCDDVCNAQKGYICNSVGLDSPDVFASKFSTRVACTMPLLSGCGNDSATYDADNQFCYYPGTDCVATGRPAITVACSTRLSGIQRFCACKVGTSTNPTPPASNSTSPSTTSTPGTPSNPSTPSATSSASNTTEDLSGAATTPANLMSSAPAVRSGITATLALALLFVSPRTAFVFMVFLGLTSGHNWMNSQSRSNGASLFRPYKPATTDLPHIQVGPGQVFNMEWMNGHGLMVYFIFVHEKNAKYFPQIKTQVILDYINQAPADKVINATSGKWQKFHRKVLPSGANILDNKPISPPADNQPNFWNRTVPSTDPLFISRSPLLRGIVSAETNPTDSNTYLMQYNLEEIKNDVRVSYRNHLYPYIDQIYGFEITSHQSREPDTANFWLPDPSMSGFGRYLVQFRWNSYYDVVDVDYMNTTVDAKYGFDNTGTTWSRVDHCIFPDPQHVFEFSEVVSDVQWCLDRCAANPRPPFISSTSTYCDGVMVAPLMAPSTAYNFSKPAGDVWFHANIPGSDIYVPWDNAAFKGAYAADVTKLLTNPSPNKYMCYTVMARHASDTEDSYYVTKDPVDPAFYSSCYFPYAGNSFIGYSNSTTPTVGSDPNWKFSSGCVSCSNEAYNSYGTTIPASWNLTDTCVNCDNEPKKVSGPNPAPIKGYLVEPNTRCDGKGGVWDMASHHTCGTNAASCNIQMWPAGRKMSYTPQVSTGECRAMTMANSACSDNFYLFQNGNATECWCYASLACCSSCSRKYDTYSDTYDSTYAADPTCANGVVSSDNKFCCDKSCGANGCVAASPFSASVATKGFCTSNSKTTRSCKFFSAPCVM